MMQEKVVWRKINRRSKICCETDSLIKIVFFWFLSWVTFIIRVRCHPVDGIHETKIKGTAQRKLKTGLTKEDRTAVYRIVPTQNRRRRNWVKWKQLIPTGGMSRKSCKYKFISGHEYNYTGMILGPYRLKQLSAFAPNSSSSFFRKNLGGSKIGPREPY